jgi:GNAT superfamily N-acetyltransferase
MRVYTQADFGQCSAIVKEVWDFEVRYGSPEIAQILSDAYTGQSLSESNYAWVAEDGQAVIGFIFGRTSGIKQFRHKYGGILGQVRVAWRLLLSSGGSLSMCLRLFSALRTHEANRRKLLRGRDHEVILFCMSRRAQGKGMGQEFMTAFLDDCRRNGVRAVSLDTDKKYCNYGFYERFGYKLVGYFSSPLQLFYSGKSDECCTYVINIAEHQKRVEA